MAKVKNKKSNLADTYAKRRKQQQMTKKTLTPFEVHINKDKQNVLGRKSKADRGLPGIARTKAIAKRKNTLLHEYKVKDKDNIFLDKRIGERNSKMSQEDKVMARFAAERVKAHSKKNIFNLNDDEVLTHRGQSLMDIEKYDDPRSDEEDYSDNENATGKLDKKFVADAHFGGGVLSKPNSEMSRKDVIEQLIAESKKRKAERQKIREDTIDLTEKLDSEWKDLLPLVSSSNKAIEVVEEKPAVDDYDKAMRELKFEARGVPTDKLKSEEVVAREEQEKIEKLEQDRLARMQGFTGEEERRKKHRSADDLDDFHIERIEETSDNEEDNQKKENEILKDEAENEENDEEDNEDDDEENDEGDDDDEEEEENVKEVEDKKEDSEVDDGIGEENLNGKESEEEEEDSEDDLSDLKASESESEDEIVQTKIKKKPVASEKPSKQNTKDESKCTNIIDKLLSKSLEVPVQKKEEKIEQLNMNNPTELVEKVIKGSNWRLIDRNKEKVLNLFSYMMEYIDKESSVESTEELVKFFQIFERLCPHLYDLAHADPLGTKGCVHDILKAKHDHFESRIKVYPGFDTLILFKLVSLLYPTSDFRHPIVTPCLVFMSQILLKCKLKSKQDISKGLFVCTLILEYTLLSKKWSPEVINFLRGIIYISLPKPFSKVIKPIPPFKSVGETSNVLVLEKSHNKSDIDAENIKMKAGDLIDDEIDDDYKIRIFSTAINMLSEFQDYFKELDAAYSVFEPILTLLKLGSVKRYPKKIREKVKALVNDLEKLKEKELEYLTFEKKKPKAMRMYEPKIEVVYDGKRHRPMSKAKAEREKLLHKLKKETKSAIREVRRDNAFLAKVRIKQQIASDTERKRKVKEIFGDAALQQHELKKFKKK